MLIINQGAKMRRKKMSKKKSKKLFKKTALKSNKKNYNVGSMRGGYRL